MSAEGKQHQFARQLAIVLTIVALIGGGIWFWEDVAKDRLIPKSWAVVEEHAIYRSGQLSAALVKKTLVRCGIQVIVTLAHDDPKDRDMQAEKTVAAELGIELRRFPLGGDGTGDVNNYAGAVAAVIEARRQGRPVLVHCIAGAQRTGGVLACYQLLVEKKPPAAVVEYLLRHEWRPKRNPYLLPYLNQNLGTIAQILRTRGLLDEVPCPMPVLQVP